MTKTDSNDNLRRVVRQTREQFWMALKGKDKQAFENLLAEDFILRSPGQTNQGRAAFSDTLTSLPAQVRSVGSDNLEVHFGGEIAMVTGAQSAQLEWADGRKKLDRIAITNFFRKSRDAMYIRNPVNHKRNNIMRLTNLALIFAGLIHFVLAIGFFFQQGWAMALWPLPDTPLSYAFIASILAGGGAPLIWIGLSGELGALAGYGLGFGIMYAGMGLAALGFYLRDQAPSLGWFALVMGVLAGLGFIFLLSMRRDRDAQDSQPTPRIVRLAFLAEVAVLAGAGTLLVLKVPNTLPWNLSPESSVLYGWVFIGLAFYYLYAVLNPQWIHALGPLIGFLVYDLVLFGPLVTRYGNLQPEHVLGQVTATLIILFSAGLGIYYLFVNSATRLGTRSGSSL